MGITLKELYLGCADGNTESNANNFLDLFYTKNHKYDEIKNNQMKFIISGKKGTGKTILGRYIEAKSKLDNTQCKIFNVNDLNLMKLIEKNNDELLEDEAVAFYKWSIYYDFFILLKEIKFKFSFKHMDEFIKHLKFKYHLKKLSKFFEERYPQGNFESGMYTTNCRNLLKGEAALGSTATSHAKTNEKKTSFNIDALHEDGKQFTYTKKKFYKVLKECEDLLLACLKYKNAIIILDDIDELDIKLDTNSLIKKIIDAFKDINTLLFKNKLHSSKCIMLLRSDILQELNKNSSNLNKILIDNTVELYWITKDEVTPEKHMLMEMILNKIKTSSNEYQNYDNKKLYYKLFPRKISSCSILKFLIDQGFGRPRDIICYLNIVQNTFPNETVFLPEMFKQCKIEYSKTLLNELYNEIHMYMSSDILDDYLSLLRTLGMNSFNYSQINSFYENNKDKFKHISNIDTCLNDLYVFGIIGNSWTVKTGTSKEKIKYSWGYRKDGNPSVDFSKRFSVHYGLRKALNTNNSYESKEINTN